MNVQVVMTVLSVYALLILPSCKYKQPSSKLSELRVKNEFQTFSSQLPEGRMKEGVESLSAKVRKAADQFSIYSSHAGKSITKMSLAEVRKFNFVNSLTNTEEKSLFYIEPLNEAFANGLVIEAQSNFQKRRLNVRLYDVNKKKLRRLSSNRDVKTSFKADWKSIVDNYTVQVIDLKASGQSDVRRGLLVNSQKTSVFYENFANNAKVSRMGLFDKPENLFEGLQMILNGFGALIAISWIAVAVIEAIELGGGTFIGFLKVFGTEGTIGNTLLAGVFLVGCLVLAYFTLAFIVLSTSPRYKGKSDKALGKDLVKIHSGLEDAIGTEI